MHAPEHSVDSTNHEPQKSVLDMLPAYAVDSRDVPNDRLIAYVYGLQAYVDDPDQAIWRDQQRGKINDIPYTEDGNFGRYTINQALERLHDVAETGRTYLSRVLADDVIESPIGQFQEHAIDPDFLDSPMSYLTEETSQMPKVHFDGNQLRSMREYLASAEKRGEISSADYFMQRAVNSRDVNINRTWQILTDQLSELDAEGYLDYTASMHDSVLLGSIARGDVYLASYRTMHLAYTMDSSEKATLIDPYHFAMKAYGEITEGTVDPAFYDDFVMQQPVDYKDIVANGLTYTPVRMSPKTVGFFEESGHLVSLYDLSEAQPTNPDSVREVAVKDIADTAFKDYSPDELQKATDLFYQTGCSLRSRYIIEKSIGLKLSDYELDEQLAVVQLLNRATDQQIRAVAKSGADVIVGVARSLEFGDDFGNRLLTIAEHATPEQAKRIFEGITRARRESELFAGMYESYDPALAAATERAMNERVTDILAVAERVVQAGRVTVDVAPHRDKPDYVHDGRFDITLESIDRVANQLDTLCVALELRREIVDDPDTVVSRVVANEQEVGYQIYRFSHPTKGDALLHLRAEGAGTYDKAFEYGNYGGVEATGSWVVNPTGDHRLTSDKDPNGISFRFDREGRAPGETPDSPERSPIREDGLISLDMSSGMGRADTAAVQLGRTVAAGNILRAEEVGGEVSLHHNTNHFDQQKYGSAKGFKELIEYLHTMAEARIATRQSWTIGSQAMKAVGASPRL